MKTYYYATPREEFPIIDGGTEIGFYYVEGRNGDCVKGTNLDKVVRLAVEKLEEIVEIGRIG